LQVTDLDLLAFEFGPTLQRRKYIGEAKSGTGKSASSPLDRIVWLRGLRELTNADGAELTISSTVSLHTRELASSLGIVAQSTQDLERRERQLRVAEVANLGSYGLQALHDQQFTHRYCRQDPELERAFWFLRSEAWLLDSWLSIKRTMVVLARVSKRWVPGLSAEEDFALRWLICEGTCVVALHIVTVAGQAVSLPPDLFAEYVSDRLSEGLVSRQAMARMADVVDKFIDGILTEASVPASVRVNAMGAFTPQPPDYTEQLIELTRRLATGAIYARHVPRYLDLVLFERILHKRDVVPHAIPRLGLSSLESVERAARLILHFLQGYAYLPSTVVAALQEQPIATGTASDNPDASAKFNQNNAETIDM
jgi:hypothetical protein